KRELQEQFKRYYDSVPSYQTTLTTREYDTFVKVINALQTLEDEYKKEREKILKKMKENQKKFLNKLKKFPEIKELLTYITIGHISKKKKEVLKKGLNLEGLHIKDYIQFCAIEFPDLNKINFKTLMNGMILNGSNW
ncbi:13313_t:CDS:2, partial [Gigaspora rosea]